MAEEIDINDVDAIAARFGEEPGALIAMLQAIQKKYNYLPEAALRRISLKKGYRLADIMGVATFYDQFRLKPAGRHFIKVCVGTACHVKGADRIFDSFRRDLNIEGDGDTDADRLFTVERVACLGCCMLAPAVQIDDVIYGFAEPGRTAGLIKDFLKTSADRENPAKPGRGHRKHRGHIRICLCSSCSAGGAKDVYDAFGVLIEEMDLPVALKEVGCTGASFDVPFVELIDDEGRSFRYGRVAPADVRGMLLRHFAPAGRAARVSAGVYTLLERLVTGEEPAEQITRYSSSVRDGYFGSQCYAALDRAGEGAPLDIEDYISHGGFRELEKCVQKHDSLGVISRLRKSGLRGRGGAGYPTWEKWEAVSRAEGDEKYVICNGDEGDPGAFMDRMILESFPFRVIEGMIIAGLTVGAKRGFMYIRAEYPLALARIGAALEVCRERGYIGVSAGGSAYSFDIQVAAGAGAFVCGEETALIAALEGRRGMPSFRPPYPAEKGLLGAPTLVNNVETLALVPWILGKGEDRFAAMGTERSRGTKTFALAGRILRGGLIEVPMGTTLRSIVEDIGGGIEGGRRFKAVQIGGPSGGCIPAELADTPVDYEALLEKGSMMGSGGMVVLDDTDCMVDIARYFLEFTQRESCGKCTFCRTGTRHMLDILQRLCSGAGKQGDTVRLEELSQYVSKGSLCGLGKTAPNPVLTTIKYFRQEYEAHEQGRCPAGKCRALIAYVVSDKCIGCTKCAQICPVDAIPAKPYHKHQIDTAKCTRCDSCRKVCPAGAIDIVSGGRVVREGEALGKG